MSDSESHTDTTITVTDGSPQLGYKKQSPVERLVKFRNKPSRGRSAQSLTKSLMKPLTDVDVEEFKEKLEAGGDPNGDPTKWGDWRPIFWAATSGNIKILSTLLEDGRTVVDVTDNKGYTALHHAVMSACRKGDKNGRYFQCIDLLMKTPQMKLNMPDRKGYTAIGFAVEHPHKKCVEQMLKHPSARRLYLDYSPADRESTVREMILKTFPELKSVLPPPLQEDSASPDRNTKLLLALQLNDYGSFLELLETSNCNHWYGEPYYSTLLELACQTRNREDFVTLLLHRGADPNVKHRVTGLPLLHLTARAGNFDVLETLLKQDNIDVSMKDCEDRTILHWLSRVSEREPADKPLLRNCFDLLLNASCRVRINIDDKDSSGNTALHLAVERDFQDRVILLLRNGADVMVSKHGSPILSSISTSTLEDILDECVESNKEPVTSRDFRLTYRYEFLGNMLTHITDSPHLRDLLRHPVISSYLSLKWRQIKVFFFLDLAFYVTFVIFLTAYVLLSENDYTIFNVKQPDDATRVPPVQGVFFKSDVPLPSASNNYKRVVTFNMGDSNPEYLWYPLMILLGVLATRELFQFLIYGFVYLLSLENWLELLLISATFVSCSGVVTSVEVKLHFTAVAILLAWLELVLLTGRLPLLSVQLEMLVAVSWTFLRFMLGYVLLLIAFALSFYILFKGSLEQDGDAMFADPFISALKTVVMFTGELEASNLTFEALPYTSHVIFLLFVFLVAVVLLNLLNGLAVNDTEVIRKDAETLSLVARVRLINKIETVLGALPSFLSLPDKLSDRMYVLYPNRPNSIEGTAIRSTIRLVSRKRRPKKKRKTPDSQEKWTVLAEKFNALQFRQEDLEKKLDLKFEETQRVLARILAHLEARNLEGT